MTSNIKNSKKLTIQTIIILFIDKNWDINFVESFNSGNFK